MSTRTECRTRRRWRRQAREKRARFVCPTRTRALRARRQTVPTVPRRAPMERRPARVLSRHRGPRRTPGPRSDREARGPVIVRVRTRNARNATARSPRAWHFRRHRSRRHPPRTDRDPTRTTRTTRTTRLETDRPLSPRTDRLLPLRRGSTGTGRPPPSPRPSPSPPRNAPGKGGEAATPPPAPPRPRIRDRRDRAPERERLRPLPRAETRPGPETVSRIFGVPKILLVLLVLHHLLYSRRVALDATVKGRRAGDAPPERVGVRHHGNAARLRRRAGGRAARLRRYGRGNRRPTERKPGPRRRALQARFVERTNAHTIRPAGVPRGAARAADAAAPPPRTPPRAPRPGASARARPARLWSGTRREYRREHRRGYRRPRRPRRTPPAARARSCPYPRTRRTPNSRRRTRRRHRRRRRRLRTRRTEPTLKKNPSRQPGRRAPRRSPRGPRARSLGVDSRVEIRADCLERRRNAPRRDQELCALGGVQVRRARRDVRGETGERQRARDVR